MSDINPGDVVTMKRFVWSTDNVDFTFGPLDRKRKWAFLFIGAGGPDCPIDANKRLNALGWVYDPERANVQFEEREKAK